MFVKPNHPKDIPETIKADKEKKFKLHIIDGFQGLFTDILHLRKLKLIRKYRN
jgi:hypothetical protein